MSQKSQKPNHCKLPVTFMFSHDHGVLAKVPSSTVCYGTLQFSKVQEQRPELWASTTCQLTLHTLSGFRSAHPDSHVTSSTAAVLPGKSPGSFCSAMEMYADATCLVFRRTCCVCTGSDGDGPHRLLSVSAWPPITRNIWEGLGSHRSPPLPP